MLGSVYTAKCLYRRIDPLRTVVQEKKRKEKRGRKKRFCSSSYYLYTLNLLITSIRPWLALLSLITSDLVIIILCENRRAASDVFVNILRSHGIIPALVFFFLSPKIEIRRGPKRKRLSQFFCWRYERLLVEAEFNTSCRHLSASASTTIRTVACTLACVLRLCRNGDPAGRA